MQLLRLDHLSIFEQLQLEEALLRAGEGNWCLLNRGTTPAVVMGISGKRDELLDGEEVARQGLPVIRRFSGGGTVVVDEETLFVTFIGDTSLAQPYPESILRWVANLYPEPLAAWENDFIIGSRKCGGNAQYIRKGRWLHHTSFLWDFSRERMGALLHPRKTPKYRAGRSHLDFLTPLKEHFASPQLFLDQLLERVDPVVERSYEEVAHILHLPHRKATRAED